MTIGRRSGLSANTVYRWLDFNERLKYLEVADWSPKNQQDYLDRIPLFVPTIRHLRLSVSCISKLFFTNRFRLPASRPGMSSELHQEHPLKTWELTSNPNVFYPPLDFPIQPVMVYLTIATNLHNLRTFRVNDALGWWSNCERRMILAAIYQSMEQSAQIRGDTSKIDVSEVTWVSNHRRIHSR